MNFVRSNNLSLKYQRFITSGLKDIEVWIFEFVTKTQFLLVNYKCRMYKPRDYYELKRNLRKNFYRLQTEIKDSPEGATAPPPWRKSSSSVFTFHFSFMRWKNNLILKQDLFFHDIYVRVTKKLCTNANVLKCSI